MITPVELFTVAIDALLLVHVPPASPSLVNVVVPFEHTGWSPLNTPALGASVTVMVRYAVTSSKPSSIVTEYVVVVDGETVIFSVVSAVLHSYE